MKPLANRTLVAVAVVTLAACATAAPPKALVSARVAYQDARHKAAANAPVELDEARMALKEAESEFRDSARSQATTDLAYIAERRAQLAVAVAQKKQAEAKQAQAETQYEQLEARMYKDTREELVKTSGALQDERRRSENLEGDAADANARAQAALDRLAASAQVSKDERGTVINLSGGVLFASGKSELLPAAQRSLQGVADALKAQEENKRVVIEGHTDSRGEASFNQRLSQARAESVRDYLVSQGVDENNVSAKGMGESRPLTSNDTPEGRANNRRVEIIIEE